MNDALRCQLPRCSLLLGTLPSSAPHKRFCCAAHRMEWHALERQRVREALRKEREAEEQRIHQEVRELMK